MAGRLDHSRIFDAAVFDIDPAPARCFEREIGWQKYRDPTPDRARPRAAVDLDALGERTLWIDCDVLQADGGTRTASITGASLQPPLRAERSWTRGEIARWPLIALVAAVSVGAVGGQSLLDLNYEEDKNATVDLNLVMTSKGVFVELQGAGEEATFSRSELDQMLSLGECGIEQLIVRQRELLKSSVSNLPDF